MRKLFYKVNLYRRALAIILDRKKEAKRIERSKRRKASGKDI